MPSVLVPLTYWDTASGIASYICGLAKSSRDLGWETHVVTGKILLPNNNHRALDVIRESVSSFEVDPDLYVPPGGGGLRRAWAVRHALRRHARRTAAQIYHTHGQWMGLSCMVAGVRKSCVLTLHIEPDSSAGVARMVRRVLAPFYPGRVIAVGERTADSARKHLSLSAKKLVVIPNSANDRFRPAGAMEREHARRQLGVSPTDFLVSLVGRVNPVKGHDLLFKAIRQLRSEGIPASAICAGGWAQERDPVAWAREHGAEQWVHFTGFTDPLQAYWASDVAVLPSRREGAPLTVVEAMRCGLPTIRTATAGAEEQTIDGVTGFVIPIDDWQSLTSKIRQLLVDPALRTQMGDAGRKFSDDRFSMSKFTQSTVEVYDHLLHQSRKK